MTDRNIVVLGGSYAGITSSHYFLKHVLQTLPKDGSNYRIVLISPSRKHWHRVGGPRAIISKDALPADKYLQDIPQYFENYPSGSFTFVEASATSVDTDSRVVGYRLTQSGDSNTIPYHALIIATGVNSKFDAFNHVGDASVLESHLEDMRSKIAAASSIVVAGGGPSGVETAGEIGSLKNGEPGFFAGVNKNPEHSITVLTSDSKLLPVMRPAIAEKAEYYLSRLGVNVRYNSRVESVIESKESGKTIITLTNGDKITTDLYIPAIGVAPNTSFLPSYFLTPRGQVDSDSTLRVATAGPRVYTVGDVGGHAKRGGVMAINQQVPILMTNLQRDLQAFTSATDEKGNLPLGPDRRYEEDLSESQALPIGRSKGVGAVKGWRLPSFLVWLMKGRDFMLWTLPMLLEGKNVAKESKWSPSA